MFWSLGHWDVAYSFILWLLKHLARSDWLVRSQEGKTIANQFEISNSLRCQLHCIRNGKFCWRERHTKQPATNWPIFNGLHLQADAAEFAMAPECGTFRPRHLFMSGLDRPNPKAAYGYFRLGNGGVQCGTWHSSCNMNGNGSYLTAKRQRSFLPFRFDWSPLLSSITSTKMAVRLESKIPMGASLKYTNTNIPKAQLVLSPKYTEFNPELSIGSYGLLDLYSHEAFLTVLHPPRL